MLYARVIIVSKFKQTTTISSSVSRVGEYEYLFDLRESVLVPQFSKMIIDIPNLDFYYTTQGKESSFFIDQIKYYSDVKLVDFPTVSNKVTEFQSK